MNKNKRFLTAKEAAAQLEVSTATLYAYVSRGLIRSEEGEGKSRAKRYYAKDVDMLLAKKELRRNPTKVVESALHWGSPVLESAITLIDNGRYYYRGHDAVELAQQRPFHEVAALIWTDNFNTDLATTTPPTIIQPPLDNLTMMERFQAILPLAAAQDFAAYDLSVTAVAQTGWRILNLLTQTVISQQASAISDQSSIPNLLQQAWVPDNPVAAEVLNAALILCADHELNISSFTARCVASAGSTPYAVVLAGLAALQGPKHGGYTERVEALFHEAGTANRASNVVTSRLRRGESIPGFNHPLYPDGDPRGAALLAMTTAVAPQSPTIQLAHALTDAVQQAIDQKPTIDFGLVTLAQTLKLPPQSAISLFALGRTIGWIGHAIEQYQLDSLIRPRARYIGIAPLA